LEGTPPPSLDRGKGGEELLRRVAKVHFKTTKQVVG
jgi:hypothetical protein